MISVLAAFAISSAPFGLVESGGRWLFQHEKKTFWSLGVCCTGMGDPWDPQKPAYSALKLFPSEKAWVDDTLAKLTQNGFNSIGGWSDTKLFQKHGGKERLPYFEVLHLGAYHRAPWEDMFSKEHAQIVDKAAKDQIAKLKDDPYLVGYFSDNELGWWREALFTAYLGMPKTAPGKVEFVQFLRKHYRDSLANFKKDWIGASWQDGKMKLKPGGRGMLAVKAWQTYLTAHYYKQMRDAIRKYDKTRLILGDRYCQFYYPNVAKAAAPYVDAVSTNYGADWTDGQNTEYYLSSLHQITGRPVLITEFYMAAMENRSGNKNSSAGNAFPIVQTQKERAEAVSAYLADIGRRPYVVGAHWFQFHDEPTHGRGDGENYNMGLVDIHGQPYEELMKVFREFKPAKPWKPDYKAALPFLTEPQRKSLKLWIKAQALIRPGQEPPFGDLYGGTDTQYMYIGLASMSFTDEVLYPDKKVPEADRSELRLDIGGSKHWVRFGGDKRPCTHDPNSSIVAWRDGVRSELILRIPKPKSSKVSIEASLTTHGKADRMTWSDSRTFASAK